ncbi:MAG: cbb3-type cytochrome c oxidase subunit I [Burkholderiales bacterium]|nr:cbb3-type cytochrome c oxidase subunit I [Burkholderiales bacterium]
MASLQTANPSAALPAARRAAGTSFILPVERDASARLATGWLVLGVAALVGSGLFSVLLVLARTPGLKELFPVANFFQVALVAHVDLSVLVWFLAFAGVLWSLACDGRALVLGWASLALTAAGTLALCVAPLLRDAVPVLANYIPVIDNTAFLAGLGAIGAGVALAVARTFVATRSSGGALDGASALRWGIVGSAVATAVALAAFGWSWLEISPHLERKTYFELLFWGGGHVLQFTWTLLMLAGWLWLASALGLAVPLSPRVALLVFTIALASVFVTPAIYLSHPVASVEHHKLQTWLMRFGGGLAIPPILLALLWSMRGLRALDAERRPIFGALAASIGLFAAGGLIGFAINGPNVRIPAHYHGCIVGVTLAFMGLTYHLLPRLGFATPRSRLAAWQPWLYGGGQLMHIVGLVWSGGYGVERKVAGAAQVLRTPQEVAGMGLMGLGGLVAILGGLAFVVVVIGAMRRQEARG